LAVAFIDRRSRAESIDLRGGFVIADPARPRPHVPDELSAEGGGRAHTTARFRPRRKPFRWRVHDSWRGIAPQLAGQSGEALLRRPLFLAFVAANLISVLYFGLIASPVYVSRASLTVLNPTLQGSNLTSMLSGGSGDGTAEAAYVLKDYVGSWQAFHDLAGQTDLARNFSKGDIFGRYGGLSGLFQKSDVALWRYYRKHVRVDVDVKSGIASVEVHAFQPGFASRLADAVLADALDHMNRMGREQADADLAAARAKAAAVQTELAQTDAALARYRSSVGVYDPKEEYASDLDLLNQLGGKEAELRSQYAAVQKATPDSPVLQNLSDAVASVQGRMATARARFPELGRVSAEYERLAGLRDNQQNLLQQVSLSEQQAMRTSDQSRYFMQLISPPSQPQTPELPDRALWIGGIFLVSLLIWGLLR
jgi:capsular polysaccharide transport system permease protein